MCDHRDPRSGRVPHPDDWLHPQRQVQIHPRPKFDDSQSFTDLKFLTRMHPANDPAGQNPGDLADQNPTIAGLQADQIVLVDVGRLRPEGLQELTGDVFHERHLSLYRCPVHVYVEQRHKDADP